MRHACSRKEEAQSFIGDLFPILVILIFLAMGGGFLVKGLVQRHVFREATGVVQSARYYESSGKTSKGATYTIRGYHIVAIYEIEGQTYQVSFDKKTADKINSGDQITFYYDTRDPKHAITDELSGVGGPIIFMTISAIVGITFIKYRRLRQEAVSNADNWKISF